MAFLAVLLNAGLPQPRAMQNVAPKMRQCAPTRLASSRSQPFATGMKSLRIPGLVVLFLWTVAAQAADPARSAPKATPIQPARTGAEIVGNLLTPGPSDPDVPLPSPALKDDVGGGRSPTGPRIYGREETGGAVFGLRFP